jgi:ArsR family transcriptional regulator
MADPTRFELLERAARKDRAPTCSALCEESGRSKATVSHHLSELEDAGLVKLTRESRVAYVEIDRAAVEALLAETRRRLAVEGK